ncbi:hypothetical protein RI129_011491 [Pyrocoelia pectoralis]|uniref:MADF domain-containing protein n=1 Tax=Pyrocoelia pectoralis TaxID=417401 RepID=A0AAN7V7Y5_9COLE
MDELLIENVRKHVCIYNVKCQEYRDQHIRQTAWEENRCKKKNLWKFELQMDFLTPFIETRKTHNNLSDPEVEENTHVTEEPELEEQIATQMEDDQSVLDNADEQNHKMIDEEDLDKRYDTIKRSKNKKRQKTSNTQGPEILQILKENSERIKRKYEENTSTKNNTESMDDMDMFFLSMSRMTKQLPKIKQAEIKLSVSNMVLRAELLNEEQNFLQPPPLQRSNGPVHVLSRSSESLQSPPPNNSIPLIGKQKRQAVVVEILDQLGNIIPVEQNKTLLDLTNVSDLQYEDTDY